MKALEQQQLSYWLALDKVPGFGPVLAARILQQFTLAELFSLTARSLNALGFKDKQVSAITSPDWDSVERQLRWQEAAKHHILPFTNSNYPRLLKEISSPPLILYIQGEVETLNSPQIAMVGSRSPSTGGKETAYFMAQQLINYGVTPTSGLALGIDAVCHQAAVDKNRATIAVLGTGIDLVYPRRHKRLSEQILQNGGVIVSEFSLGTPAIGHNFPRRNRIISGLSLGTLVVEAALKSGSLITARFALEQNREVFAIPGSINSPLSKGGHYLIRQGAKLVEQVEHILEELQNLKSKPINDLDISVEKSLTKSLAGDGLLVSVGYEPTPVDSVVAHSGLTVAAVLQQLLKLELQGLVSAVPGGYIRLRGS